MSNYYDLLKEFFVTDFKLRYKHSYLGFLWVILKPLSYYTVLYVVWTALFGNTPDFSAYLLIGILALSYFNEGVQFGLQSLFNKAHIILKVNFPREVVVFSSVAIATVNFLINFGIFIVFRIVSGKDIFSSQWWYFVIGFLLLTILLLGISFYTSVISIKFQDIKHLVELVLQLMFWATPIFYQLDKLPTRISTLLTWGNPLVLLLGMLRAGLLNSAAPPAPNAIIAMAIFVIVFTTLGFFFFKKSLPKVAEFF